MIREAAKNAQQYFKDGKKTLSIRFENDSKNGIVINGDRGRMTEVVDNLLNNAIKFTTDGAITVKLKTDRDMQGTESAVVSVRDSGTGIDGEIMPRLFTKFTSKSEHGTGLGLFISKSIVESHGGKIWAENNSDGKGATLAFSLPLS